MLTAVFIAFLSPIFFAFSNLFDAHVSNALFKKNSSLLFYLSITNLLLLPILIIIGGKSSFDISAAAFPYVFITAALEILYLIPYFIALRRIDTSIVCALFSLAKICLPISAWLLVDERLAVGQYVGFFIVVGASLVLSLNKTSKFNIDLSFYLMALASVMVALGSVFAKKALLGMNWVSFTVYVTIISDLFVFLLLFIPKYKNEIISEFSIFKKNLKLLLFMELFDRGGNVVFWGTLSVLPVVVESAIGSTQAIFVLLYGFILHHVSGYRFNESFAKTDVIKKLICFVIIIFGVVLTIR